MPKKPTCEAVLRDGSRCRSVQVETVGGAGFCAPHAKRVAAEGNAAGPSSVVDAVEEPAVSTVVNGPDSGEVPLLTVAPESGPLTTDPPTEATPVASLRGELRAGLVTSEVAELIRSNIVAGLAAFKDFYTTCPGCKHRHPVSAPDIGVRVNAAEKLLEALEGRLRQESATLDQKLDKARQKVQADLASCTDEELELMLLALHDGEPPSEKETARELAEKLLADRAVGHPREWLTENLSRPEQELLGRVAWARDCGWRGFEERVYELAEQVIAGASAPA